MNPGASIPSVDYDDKFGILRWSVAGLVVAGAHAGLVAGYMLLSSQSGPAGAPAQPIMIDFAAVAAAPESVADLAPGPESAEAEEMIEPEVKQEIAEEPVVEVPPVPTPEPEIVIPPKQEMAESKPEEKPNPKPAEKLPEKKKQTKSVARTTSNPHAAKRAQTAAAPNPGSVASSTAIPAYRDMIAAHLQRHKQYPAAARAAGQTGTAVVAFTIDRNGRVLARSLSRSSGSAALDAEVLAMIMRAQPMPAFPAAMTQAKMAFSVPIRFSVR